MPEVCFELCLPHVGSRPLQTGLVGFSWGLQDVYVMLSNDLSCQKSFFGLFPKSSPLSLSSSFICLSRGYQQMVFRFAHIDFASCRNRPEHLPQCRALGQYDVEWVRPCTCPWSAILLPVVESVSRTLHLS